MAGLDNSSASDQSFRVQLGRNLVIGSVIALVLLGIVIIVGSARSNEADAVMRSSQLLLSSLLPLFGTWVGTVLAFYYSKENFEAANRGTLDAVRAVSQRLRSTPVSDKMMPRNQLISATVPADQSLNDLKLKEIQNLFDTKGANGRTISRLIILDSNGACLGILHKATWNEMLVLGLRDHPPLDINSDTLGKIISKPYTSPVGTTFLDFVQKTIAFASTSATVADAKSAMEQVPSCQDVIITQSGSRAEATLGWITNVDITRLSQAQ